MPQLSRWVVAKDFWLRDVFCEKAERPSRFVSAAANLESWWPYPDHQGCWQIVGQFVRARLYNCGRYCTRLPKREEAHVALCRRGQGRQGPGEATFSTCSAEYEFFQTATDNGFNEIACAANYDVGEASQSVERSEELVRGLQ